MRINHVLPLGIMLLLGLSGSAQQKKPLTLDEAINIAVTQSTEAALADTRVNTAGLNVDNVKNNAYPDFKISGQYQRLTEPSINLRVPMGGEGESGESGSSSTPKVNQVILGMAQFSLPVFSGFRLKNNIAASESMYKAQTFNAASVKEQLAMQAIVLYANLYKAQQSVSLIEENLKSANQRVTDFTAMEQNGLLARNDLLKAQLQASNIQLSLDDAKMRVSTINYQLITLLKLPEGTQIAVTDAYFNNSSNLTPSFTESDAIAQRSDLEALRWQEKASQSDVDIAKADYYPSLSLVAGYTALDIQNFVEVHNAINFGVALSYDISNIFKNNKKVRAAESRAEEAKHEVEIKSERVKVEVQQSLESYNLALKQNKVYTQAVEQAGENYRIVKDKYDNGLVDTNDLLEADVEQLQAKLNQTFSKADITQRYYELLNASGRLTQSFNLTQNKQ
ncbi:transporter [Flavobacterium akiainvivens]|uniref:Transporter n=1 Tax=Flavobacterium akiainvivens TaxID=1202724 RepID=A0A0M8MFV7_9FLAO|nr:TolC family protein [Flavobacterium akiainvivens]KOS04748.1 transporter [Flavobacterium akiainvivens]SFQ66731.1 Outer membrane protein TolC [Flavobacterium akiainvivens]